MSGKPKAVRKILPEIPSGVQPASPLTTANNNIPLLPLPRSFNLSTSLAKNVIPSKPHQISSKGEDSSVCVAVRVRPFSKKETLMGASQVVAMTGSRTSIVSGEGKVHIFNFDHCFWSVSDRRGGEGNYYAGQEDVYKKLAQPLLDNSFKGYNTCLFAYGQTGSGKSYCIMGEGEEVGIIPHFTKELFDRVESTTDIKNTYNLQVSYLEIYNEKVYDLLKSNTKQLHKHKTKFKLRVREHQVFGPYVEDLSTFVATSYSDIEHWLRIGNRCRATNATSMNDRSSRSHAVFTIHLTHTTIEEEEEHSTVSRINIIDLAGSERSKVAETSGDRLKEGASINKSLHTLGKVISLLSDQSTGRREKVYIPYRDSTLTWLLKDSLGGNSKTAMIATISPADLHYQDSISTLRYAQTARSIVNVARINEDPNVKMIRELTSEIHHLRGILAMQGGEAGLAEIMLLREQLLESEKLITEATRSWKEKLKETEERKKEEIEQFKQQAGAFTVNSHLPNLVNLTEDPQLSEILLFILKPGVTTVGNCNGDGKSHDIELTGALVVRDHCVFVHEGNSVCLEPSSILDAQTYVNGQLLLSPTFLHHGDRVVLGGDYFFRFSYPLEIEGGTSTNRGHRDFEFARNELVKAQTERLERESEEKILKEREQMLSELETIRQSAQLEMDQQQVEYQNKLQELEAQNYYLTRQRETNMAAEIRVEELLRQNQELEEETVAQRHIIHLEKIRTEKESRELEEQRNHLMLDLEKEKHRLEEDILKLHKNKGMRDMQSTSSDIVLSTSRDSLLTTNSQSSDSDISILHRGSELVRVSMMLQEAAAICKTLNKPLSFTRDEGPSGIPCVRISNHQTNMVAYWDMNKFETRIEQMREIYQMRGSATSLDMESNSTSPIFNNDPFSDPSDGWASSPFRSLPRCRSMFSTPSTPSLPTSTSGKPLQFDLKSPQFNSLVALSSITSPGQSSSNSTLSVIVKQLSRMLNFKKDSIVMEGSSSVLERMMTYVCRMKKDINELAKMIQYPNTIEAGDTENIAFSIYSSLEALTEGSMCVYESCLQWKPFLVRYRLNEHLSSFNISSKLIETLCHQTALYFTKLLKGGESHDCYEDLQASIDSISHLIGELWLAREVQGRLLYKQFPSQSSECPVFLYQSSRDNMPPAIKPMVIQGICDGCIGAVEFTFHAIKESVSTLSQCGGWGEHVQNLVGSTLTFLQYLIKIQPVIWTADVEPLPLPPAIDLLLLLHDLEVSLTTLPNTFIHDCQVAPETCQQNAKQAADICKELAVSVLNFLKSLQVDSAKIFSAEIQTLSHQMVQAGKSLNHFLKKGLS